MAIISFEFNKITASRDRKASGNINVVNDVKIINLESEELNLGHELKNFWSS